MMVFSINRLNKSPAIPRITLLSSSRNPPRSVKSAFPMPLGMSIRQSTMPEHHADDLGAGVLGVVVADAVAIICAPSESTEGSVSGIAAMITTVRPNSIPKEMRERLTDGIILMV